MKRHLLVAAMSIVCGIQLFCQMQPYVSIKLNEEERFRFEGYRFATINPSFNVYVGDSAGATGINSKNNVAVGRAAGYNDTSGFNNVYIGAYSGFLEIAGNNNTYIGFGSGKNCDSTYSNTFIGSWSGRLNTTGNLNTFIGRRAGNMNSTGSENTFIGQCAGFSNNTGSCNTYIGRVSGYYNQSGDSNIFIGYLAGTRDNASNRLVISNRDTTAPLVYGEFDTPMLRFNAGRLEITNPNKNTIIGDSSAVYSTGSQNVIIGSMAGKNLIGGLNNTFIGYQAGLVAIGGSGNVFIGMRTGWQTTTGPLNAFVGTNAGFANTTGQENTYLGTSAGANNTTGNYNTCLGRRTGLNNKEGSGNIFIGYYAGADEMGSNKLYIANSGTTEPLIYGDFEEKKLKFYADSVEATGVIRSDAGFNVAGEPGINYSYNTVTDIDFAQEKLKYRTIVISGGIITYVSQESAWADTVGPLFEPCGIISIIGEFNEWQGDYVMIRNIENMDLWSTTIRFTIEDDTYPEVGDSIIEVKFRADGNSTVNWGSTGFPSGTGTQGGENIPVQLDDNFDTTIYYVTFNCRTGEYDFENLSGYCPDSITDSRDGKKYATVLIRNQCWMAQDLNVGTRIDGGINQMDDETIQKYCYDDLESNCTQWGGLYQWPELMGHVTTAGVQGICPDGFHVPTDAEFKILEGNVDSRYGPGSTEWDKINFRGFDAGYNLRATEGWNGSDNGSDAFGFHAVAGGYYSEWVGAFNDSGCCNQYFTSTLDVPSNMAMIRHMNVDVGHTIMRNTNSTADGCSLRCVKD